jgi:Transposase
MMKKRKKVSKKAAKAAASEVAPQGRRFDEAQKQHALVLVASGMSREQVAKTIGTTTESLRRWVKDATAQGAMPTVPVPKKPSAPPVERTPAAAPTRAKSPYAPADPAQGLSDIEVAGILEWKKKHPSMGPAQLRAQLKRFNGWRLSIKAIARVLRGYGYALVHTKGRPVGPEPVRFEAPRRNALWQADFCEVRVGDERLHLSSASRQRSRVLASFARPVSRSAPSPRNSPAKGTSAAGGEHSSRNRSRACSTSAARPDGLPSPVPAHGGE